MGVAGLQRTSCTCRGMSCSRQLIVWISTVYTLVDAGLIVAAAVISVTVSGRL